MEFACRIETTGMFVKLHWMDAIRENDVDRLQVIMQMYPAQVLEAAFLCLSTLGTDESLKTILAYDKLGCCFLTPEQIDLLVCTAICYGRAAAIGALMAHTQVHLSMNMLKYAFARGDPLVLETLLLTASNTTCSWTNAKILEEFASAL